MSSDLPYEITFGVVLFFIIAYMYFTRKRQIKTRSPSVSVTRPTAPNTPLSYDDEDLLGIAPVQRVIPVSVKLAKVGFPSSPVMPDLNEIDGIAPFNPQ